MPNILKEGQADQTPGGVEGTTAPIDPKQEPKDEYVEAFNTRMEERKAQRRSAPNPIDVKVGESTSEPTSPEQPTTPPVDTQKEENDQNQAPMVQLNEQGQPIAVTENVSSPENTQDDSERFTQAFSKLSRREKELQQKQQELKAQADKLQKLEELSNLGVDDPQAVLDHFGWDYDKLTQHMLNQPTDDKPKVDPKLVELEQKQAEIQKRLDDDAAKRLDQAIYDVKTDIKGRVQAEKEKYELCNIYGDEAVDIVYNVIDTYYNENQQILSYEDALEATENWLLEYRVKPATEAAKLKNLMNSKPEAKQAEGEPPQQGQQAPTQSKTLTNSLDATPPTGEPQKLTREQKRELMKKTLKWD